MMEIIQTFLEMMMINDVCMCERNSEGDNNNNSFQKLGEMKNSYTRQSCR